jgi:hypothetical protein
MRRAAVLLVLLVVAMAGCKDSEATCENQPLPDGGGGYATCEPGPACKLCWSCQTFGSSPGWKLIGGGCDAPLGPDAPVR